MWISIFCVICSVADVRSNTHVVVVVVIIGFHGSVFSVGTSRKVRVLQHDGRVDWLHRSRTSCTSHSVADVRWNARAGRVVTPTRHVQRHTGSTAVPAIDVQTGRAQLRVSMLGHQRCWIHRQPWRTRQSR